MSDEQIRQRIAYLLEHGGIADDPIEDIRRSIRVLYWMVGVALLLNVARTLADLFT